ncbi:hypothetical protein BJX99DRAFT_240167 [Aspergillus californicus]
MADPFSITGSAVGVVSLGLTLCQGFLAYYGPYKSFHEDIDEILSRIRSLNALLNTLHKVVAKSHPAPVTHLATKNIVNCQQGLQKLEKMLDKCHKICPPDREKSSGLKYQYSRLLYPFRRETLMKLMDTVAWLQSNVDTALHVTEISMLDTTQQSMELVLSNTMSTASNTHKLIDGVETLENQNTTINSTLTMLVQRIDQMESHIKANSGKPITTPKLLKSLLDTQEENNKAMTSLLPKLQRLRVKKKAPRCRCDRVGAQSRAHRPWCPLQNQSRDLVSLNFRHNFCNRFLGFSITTSLTMTKGAGGFSISPNLQFRAVVPEDSPAFSLLQSVFRSYIFDISPMIGKSEIRRTHQELFELFHTGLASPTDTLENGDTILHAVTTWQRCNYLWDDEAWADWQAFIGEIIATGVSPGALNDLNMTPADIIFQLYEGSRTGPQDLKSPRLLQTVNLCVKLLERGSYITSPALDSDMEDLPFPTRHSQGMDTRARIPLLQLIVKKHGAQDIEVPDELQPLISQSVEELYSLLHDLGSFGPEASSYFDFYAEWPAGLAIILDHGYTPTDDALDYAIQKDCVPCVKMMLECDKFSLEKGTFHWVGGRCDEKPEIRKLIIKAFASRRRRLQVLAETRLPVTVQAQLNLRPETLLNRKAARTCHLLQSYSVDIIGLESSKADCVYFIPSMGLDLWNELWDAGFRDVDEPDEGEETALTALTYRYHFGSTPNYLQVCLERASWLISRGADLHRFLYSSPAIHHLAKNIAEHIADCDEDGSSLSEQSAQFLHLILLDDFRDDCNCACSAGGCFAFKIVLESNFNWAKSFNASLSRFRQLSAIFYTIDRTLNTEKRQDFYGKLAPRAIRYLTFCELDLTHTCGYDYEKMKSERVREIQEEEASLITQLDSLVDELLEQYRMSPLTLHQFLKEDWREKMDEIHLEMPDDQEAAALRRVGVTLQDADRELSWCDLLNGPRVYYPPRWLFA